MKKSARRTIEIFSMSFLDAISCGFGAIILLLIITLASEPRTVQRVSEDLREKIAEVEGALKALTGEAPVDSGDRAEAQRRLQEARSQVAELKQQRTAEQERTAQAQSEAEEQAKREGELKAVQQSLTEEMKRLLAQPAYKQPGEDSTVGGIPVDSEYVIFIIDTSGSMVVAAWPLVLKKFEEVLKVHPQVKGIQVMSDIGTYMFPQYAGEWIPDSPARRKAIMTRLSGWRTFSKSNPVDGILHSVRQFFKDDRRISLYVFGDDFSSGTIDEVLAEVASINKRDGGGNPRVRVHAFGFPVLFLDDRGKANRTRFAHLMRLLAEQNQGSFVGLTTLK